MDIELLYQNLTEMGFPNQAIQEAISFGHTSIESALNFLTTRQVSSQPHPLTFQQASNSSCVLKLGRTNEETLLSDSSFPFSKPIMDTTPPNNDKNDLSSNANKNEESVVKSRYQKNFKESLLEKEHQRLVKEMKEDKERKSKAHHDILKAIHEDRQAIKERSQPMDVQPTADSKSNINQPEMSKGPRTNSNICRLKIMIPSQSPYLIEISNDTCLGNVITELCNARSLSKESISLVSQFPRKEFTFEVDYSKTLKELQLHPSATLMCKVVNSNSSSSVAVALPPPPPVEVRNEIPMNIDIDEDIDEDNIVPDPIPNFNFPNIMPHGQPFPNADEFVPFQGSGHQLIPQNPDVTPIYHNRRPRELAGNAAVERVSTNPHYIASSPSTHGGGFIQPSRLVELCYEYAIFYIRKSNHCVLDNVRRLPEVYSHVIIERLIKDMLFTPQVAKLFKDNITYMDLGCKPLVTNALLKTVALYWKHLKTLILDGIDAMFTDEGIWELKELPNLQHLSIKSCKKFTDYGLQVVAFLPHLKSLSIRNTHVTDTGFAHLRESLAREPSNNPVNLSRLDLAGLSITCESLPCLGHFQSLTSLDLSRTQISDPLSFPDLSQLRYLNVSHCENLKLSPASLQNLNLLHSLQDLKCRGLHDVSLNDFLLYLKDKNLVNIDGILESASSVSMENLDKLADFPLHTLELESCVWLNDEYLQAISKMNSLTRLSISNCHFVTLTGLLHLVSLKNLESISLIGLQGIKENDYAFVVPQMSSSLSDITISGINECEQKELISRISRRCRYKFSCNARCFPIPNQAL